MKQCGFVLVLFVCLLAQGQQRADFASIDWQVRSLDAPTPDSLARLITTRFATPVERVRAIYAWIASNIHYNTAVYRPWAASYQYSPDPLDTAAVWPSGDEMAARKVMRKRLAVCDGYARLFKVLCQYAGIESTLVQGYARGIGSSRFRTNHTWNALKVDSVWKLVDVTWASGYLSYANDFVPMQNDAYFFTPPEQFIRDHFPENLSWALLPDPPQPAEFKQSPFLGRNYNRYGFAQYWPKQGVIEAAAGDTLVFTLQVKDPEKAIKTGNDPLTDTLNFAAWPASVFLKPENETGPAIRYSYIVQPSAQWIQLLYKDDVVVQYHLRLNTKQTAKK